MTNRPDCISVVRQQLFQSQFRQAAILGPFEAWLLTRAMRTLPLRVERMSQNALALAQPDQFAGPATELARDAVVRAAAAGMVPSDMAALRSAASWAELVAPAG